MQSLPCAVDRQQRRAASVPGAITRISRSGRARNVSVTWRECPALPSARPCTIKVGFLECQRGGGQSHVTIGAQQGEQGSQRSLMEHGWNMEQEPCSEGRGRVTLRRRAIAGRLRAWSICQAHNIARLTIPVDGESWATIPPEAPQSPLRRLRSPPIVHDRYVSAHDAQGAGRGRETRYSPSESQPITKSPFSPSSSQTAQSTVQVTTRPAP
jgi:hypothetical protein